MDLIVSSYNYYIGERRWPNKGNAMDAPAPLYYPFVALIADGIVLLLDNSVNLCFEISNVVGWLSLRFNLE